jgi:hypothetical protein
MLIVDMSAVNLPGMAKQNNLPPGCPNMLSIDVAVFVKINGQNIWKPGETDDNTPPA